MSVVVIKRSIVYLPAALAIISDNKVDVDEDDHEVVEVHELQEVHTCKWRRCVRKLMVMKMIMRKMRCILASGAVVAEVLHG